MVEDLTDFSKVVESKPLTKWKNEPKITDLKRDLREAKTFYVDHVNNVERWLDHLNITGSAKVKKQANRSSVQPRLIRKQAEWRYAALSEPFLSTDDLFNTAPETAEDKEAADQAGLVLNYQFNSKINKVAFIDEFVRTAVDEGTAVIRVGWKYEETIKEVEVPIMDIDPITNEEIQTGTTTEKQKVIIANHPTVEICHYKRILIDPTCEGDIDKAQFLIYSVETNMSEMKKDGRYKNLDNINLEDSSIYTAPDDLTEEEQPDFKFKDKPRKKFWLNEYWGYWDIDGSGIVKPIIASFVGNTVVRMEENPMPDNKFPFVFVSYLPVRKSPWGEPDGELLIENQSIIGAVTRGMIDIMGRSANGQRGVLKNVLDPTNWRRFDKGQDYEFNPGTDPRTAFYVHTFEQIPTSAEYMINQQNMDAEALTGVKAFHSGISGEALGRTATGIRSALDATSKRELGILRRLAEGIKQVGRKIMAMNCVFLSEEEVVRVTNEQFVTIRRDDLTGHYDILLTISTAEADNQKAEELAFMLQTIGNNMDIGMTKMILGDLFKLRKMPRLAQMIAAYEPQADPLVQQKAQLELALLEAQVFNERAKGQENAADIQLKAAKTQTELSKSRNLESTADKQDLEYLANESGIAHQRTMEQKEHDRLSKLDQEAAKGMFAMSKNQLG